MILNHYVQGNSGETVLLLHSGGETALTENEFLSMQLQQNYKVIRMDLRGHGKSVSNDLDNYFIDCAHDVIETLDYLNESDIHIIGASLGALIALVINDIATYRVKSLVLTGIMTIKYEGFEESSKEEDTRLMEIIELDEVIKYMDDIHEGDWRKVITNDIGKDWYPFEYTSKLHLIDKPTLLCVGENAHHELNGIEQLYMNDNVHIAIVPFAGHLANEMQPELFSKIVETFLNEITE
ncbi:alpha/beta fold hydrolase [Macrococcus armenti]|uniref:alpha/beta fold hydrolase n=1 Tax=Macrococcus armenti TaxID=2875764 RepID=UPI001CCCA0A1|nr:alpha/beta hydrolase [Macrococcus armenti]UBH08899.1 alpha/beta hydrolase [Macrococcus armenti]UBH11192.1 alpha/beta hydrolase [Macrococcus armenti]